MNWMSNQLAGADAGEPCGRRSVFIREGAAQLDR